MLNPTIPRCCGVITGWELVVQGTASGYYSCGQSPGGCLIDFIVWNNFKYDPYTVKGTATVAGVNSGIKGE
jgi:hypothetical protein